MLVFKAAIAKAGGLNRLAKEIGVTGPALSQINTGVRPISPEIAAACAEYVGADPIVAAIEALAEQSKSADTKRAWHRRITRMLKTAAVTGTLSLMLSVAPVQPVQAATPSGPVAIVGRNKKRNRMNSIDLGCVITELFEQLAGRRTQLT